MAEGEESRPPAIPQYSEMILAAIDALKEENGSNKSSIVKHIESAHGNLHTGHSNLLTLHLDRMMRSGEIVKVKNNYMRADPNAPPRRGRGRPPKPKPDLSPGEEPPAPRPRGRPPKGKGVEGISLSRPRGRPPKSVGLDGAPLKPKGTGKPRGRPPKVRPTVAVVGT